MFGSPRSDAAINSRNGADIKGRIPQRLVIYIEPKIRRKNSGIYVHESENPIFFFKKEITWVSGKDRLFVKESYFHENLKRSKIVIVKIKVIKRNENMREFF